MNDDFFQSQQKRYSDLVPDEIRDLSDGMGKPGYFAQGKHLDEAEKQSRAVCDISVWDKIEVTKPLLCKDITIKLEARKLTPNNNSVEQAFVALKQENPRMPLLFEKTREGPFKWACRPTID